jgi:hypothetical protein
MGLAPIGISVYTRLTHFKSTVSALAKNKLADRSDLYIFSDAAKPGDERLVEKVRDFAKSISGFKSLTVVEREFNSRVNNNRGGHKLLLEKYGKMIWLEDDIVTSPGFICFLNEALDFYENKNNVLSITAYSPPFTIGCISSKKDVFFLARFNAWGMAIWKDRYELIREVDPELLSSRLVRKLRKSGDDIPGMVRMDLRGDINALDVRAMFWQNVYDYWTVYPKRSLVQNIGFDGSGVHCGVSDRFSHENLWDKTSNFVFDDSPKANKSVLHENARFRKMPVLKRLYDQLPESLKKILKIVLLRR